MSLKPELEYKVAEQTARVARAAFPKSSLCMRIYDELGRFFKTKILLTSFLEEDSQQRCHFVWL